MEPSLDSVDVVVVGAGPAGLVAGIVLGNYGIDVAVLEQRREGSTLSRATVISTRCMEFLRAWGLEADVRPAPPTSCRARGSRRHWHPVRASRCRWDIRPTTRPRR